MTIGETLAALIEAAIAIVFEALREQFSPIFDLIEIIQQLTM